jgi:hypothetical protein
MADLSDIQITIDFRASSDNPEKREKQTQLLYQQLRSMEGVKVDRVVDPNPPEGSRDGGASLWGLLQAKVSLNSIGALMRFLAERLTSQPPKQPIEIKVETPNGAKLDLKVANSTDLLAAEGTIQRFLRDSSTLEQVGEARLLTAEVTKQLPGAE